jgi:hypothetical protein
MFYDQIEYPYVLEKLSKGDLAYREFKLTHKLISKDLRKKGLLNLFVKLSLKQRACISLYHKKFFWQSDDFKKNLFKSAATYLLLTVLSAVTVFINSAKQKFFKEKREIKTKTNEKTIVPKNERNLIDTSYKKDSIKLYSAWK